MKIETLSIIETAIVKGLRPHFLAIAFDEEDFIHVIISHPSFSHKSISQRIRICYNLIRDHDKNLLVNNSVIIETYDPSQLNDLLEDII